LTAPARDAIDVLRAGTKERPSGTNKGTWLEMKELAN